jgi:hypothetical protein
MAEYTRTAENPLICSHCCVACSEAAVRCKHITLACYEFRNSWFMADEVSYWLSKSHFCEVVNEHMRPFSSIPYVIYILQFPNIRHFIMHVFDKATLIKQEIRKWYLINYMFSIYLLHFAFIWTLFWALLVRLYSFLDFSPYLRVNIVRVLWDMLLLCLHNSCTLISC